MFTFAFILEKTVLFWPRVFLFLFFTKNKNKKTQKTANVYMLNLSLILKAAKITSANLKAPNLRHVSQNLRGNIKFSWPPCELLGALFSVVGSGLVLRSTNLNHLSTAM